MGWHAEPLERPTRLDYDGQDDRWYHVVATFDKPDKTIYVNGVEKASGSWNYDIGYVESLPKTRSGKIMRRLLKARELGLPEGDTSTLEDD